MQVIAAGRRRVIKWADNNGSARSVVEEEPVIIPDGGEEPVADRPPSPPPHDKAPGLALTSPVSSIFSKGQDTDLILKSSDGFDFHVYRAILLLASPAFFSITHQPDEKNTIQMTESGRILNILLTLVYPVANPVWESLDGVSNVLESAQKYRMDSVAQILAWMMISPRLIGETFFPSFIEIDPVRVFAIARGAGLQAEGDLAARATMKVSLKRGPSSPEVDQMPTKFYRELMSLRGSRFRQRVEGVVSRPMRRGSSDSGSTYASSLLGH